MIQMFVCHAGENKENNLVSNCSVSCPRRVPRWVGQSQPKEAAGNDQMSAAAAAAAKSLQSCPTLRPQRRQPTRLPHPWDSPGKNTGVGCHFLLQMPRAKEIIASKWSPLLRM